MLPGNGITAGDGKDKTCFTKEDQYKFKYGSEGLNTSDIKEYIRNPHKFNLKPEMDGRYYNLWSTDNERTDNNDDKVIKSVYDPSPVGYSLPASNAFTGFTTTGQRIYNQPDLYNVKGNFDNGWYFYKKLNKQGETFLFPALGHRCYDSSRTFAYINTSGFYWVAGSSTTKLSLSLSFDESSVTPLYGYYHSHGFSVRNAEEKKLKCGLEEVARYWVLSLHSQSFSPQNNKHLQQIPFRR